MKLDSQPGSDSEVVINLGNTVVPNEYESDTHYQSTVTGVVSKRVANHPSKIWSVWEETGCTY